MVTRVCNLSVSIEPVRDCYLSYNNRVDSNIHPVLPWHHLPYNIFKARLKSEDTGSTSSYLRPPSFLLNISHKILWCLEKPSTALSKRSSEGKKLALNPILSSFCPNPLTWTTQIPVSSKILLAYSVLGVWPRFLALSLAPRTLHQRAERFCSQSRTCKWPWVAHNPKFVRWVYQGWSVPRPWLWEPSSE